MTHPDDRTQPYTPSQPSAYTPTPAYPVSPYTGPPAPPTIPPEMWPATEPVPPRSRRLVWIAIIAVVVIGVIVAALLRFTSAGESPFVAVQKKCDSNPPAGTTIGDGGKTMIVNTRGSDDSTGMTTSMTVCVLAELHVSSAVAQHMETTRALDGRQTDKWAGYTASWTYHPDDGLDMVIQRS